MSPNGGVDLSVIIVNYNVAPDVLGVVVSLQQQQFTAPEGSPGRLEILVIDNASSPEDVVRLEGLPAGVVLVKNGRNVGFAAACNQGIQRATGQYVCFLNPDTRLLDGALDSLLQHCYQHPEVGAVGPRIWADEERSLLLPPADPPTLSFLLSGMVAGAFPPVQSRFSRWWQRRALAFWRSQTPLAVSALSGACILTSRAVIDRVGGFDPGYFLYYEDTDWCRRVLAAGYQLAYLPAAEIVHYFNQSAKVDQHAAQGHALCSQARFVNTHYGLPGTMLYRIARDMSGHLTRRGARAAPSRLTDLGCLTQPPRLRWEAGNPSSPLAIEIGHDWRFVPSALSLVRGAEYQLTLSMWDRLRPGRYCARLLEIETLRSLYLWSWVKG